MDGDNLPDDLISTYAAAKIVRKTPPTVREWIRSGRLRAWRAGGRDYLVSAAEVRSLIEPVEVERRIPTRHDRMAGHRAAMRELRAAGLLE